MPACAAGSRALAQHVWNRCCVAAQVVALEITLEASAGPARRALPRPLLQRPPVPPAERGAPGWRDAAAARALPRLCPLLLAGAVVFALAAALACHFTQARRPVSPVVCVTPALWAWTAGDLERGLLLQEFQRSPGIVLYTHMGALA